MKITVIGATGYIGSRIYALADRFTEVLGTSTTGATPYIKLTLHYPNDFDYSLISNGDAVILTAAISAPDICTKEYQRAWNVNVVGTTAFIERVLERGARVVFFSSDTVYGEQMVEVNEDNAYTPAGEYAVMKNEVERHFLANPFFKALRLSYVFSREDKFTAYLLRTASRGEEAEIFHPFYRMVIHRDDVVDGVFALVQRWDEFPRAVINFGGPEMLSRKEFADVLRDTVLPSLRYRVTKPDVGFFKNRPKVIRMVSPVLEALLGRRARTLREAVLIEFKEEKDG